MTHFKNTGFLGLGKGLHVCDFCNKEFEELPNAVDCEKEHYKAFGPKELFHKLEEQIEVVRSNASTTTEQVVVGHKKVDLGIWGETTQAQYDTRTRDVPEYQVEESVAKSIPDLAELEIIRRGEEVLPNLIGEYRSGKNIAIIKRILKKIPPKQVGLQFKKYEMFQEAEEWFSSHQLFEEAKKVRNELRVNVEQTVVEGDQITKTEIKDSVLNRSNINSGGDDKFAKLKELKEMFDSGFISNEEMEEMKKDIIGK
jgi:hypothetical protein